MFLAVADRKAKEKTQRKRVLMGCGQRFCDGSLTRGTGEKNCRTEKEAVAQCNHPKKKNPGHLSNVSVSWGFEGGGG